MAEVVLFVEQVVDMSSLVSLWCVGAVSSRTNIMIAFLRVIWMAWFLEGNDVKECFAIHVCLIGRFR